MLRGRRDVDHARDQGGWVGKALVSALLVLFAAVVAAWSLDLIGPWYHYLARDRADTGSAPSTPSRIAPPPGLRLPALDVAGPVATPLAATSPASGADPTALRGVLATHLTDPVLGSHVVAAVADLSAGGPTAADAAPVATIGQGSATPASTTKLLTTTAALEALGPQTVFTTRVVAGGRGRIVLVGGGDPLLAAQPASASDPAYPEPADVATLATLTAQRLARQGRSRVRLSYDDSLFSGPTLDPAWPADYGPGGVVAPITALWVNEGRPASGVGRVADPSLTAAQTFAAALATHGVTVLGAPRHQVAAAGARTLASVHSPPVREIVEHTLMVSDNEAAEVLAHQVGLKVEGTGSFAAGVQGVLATLAGLGVPTSDIALHDGSGLSRRDRIPPADLIAVLQAAFDPDHPELGGVADGLPVSGFSGSLADRYDQDYPDARGLVRAKTGTLTGVTALAGVVVDRRGHLLLFALMADQVPAVDETRAEEALDVAAGSLAACGCGSG